MSGMPDARLWTTSGTRNRERVREEMNYDERERSLKLLTALCVVCAVVAIPLVLFTDASFAVAAPSVMFGMFAQVELQRLREEESD